VSLCSNDTSVRWVFTSKADKVIKGLDVTYLAGSPKGRWYRAPVAFFSFEAYSAFWGHCVFEALEEADAFFAGFIKVFHGAVLERNSEKILRWIKAG
jgi:hypothetical protein